MAASIYSSMACKEVTQLVRLCPLARCSAGHRTLRLSHLVNDKPTVVQYSKITSRIDVSHCLSKQFATSSSVLDYPKVTLTRRECSSRVHINWKYRQSQASKKCLNFSRNSCFGSGIISPCRQLSGLYLGSGVSTIPARFIHKSQVEWAGHNKWSKVKHIKGPKDAQRSLLFNKLILQMRVAVKEGGSNPETNSALASLIAVAKSKTMPKATIENVLKNAARKGSGADADTHILLEARGPGQSCLLIDILTDNARRTRHEVQHILQKNGGELGTALYAFSRKGVVRVLPRSEGQENSLSLDQATEVAIEAGAEDVQETNSEDDTPLFMFICDMGDLRAVRNNLASLNYAVESSSFEYLPETTVALNDKNLEDAFQLISRLNDNPNVVKVYDNVEGSS